MNSLLQDLRYAVRMLARSPGFSAVVVLTLALGIGANTAVFSIFDQVILQLLPAKNPRELVLVDVTGPQMLGRADSDSQHTVHSYPAFVTFKQRSEVFTGVIARTGAPLALAYGGAGERVDGELVSGNFFDVLGVKPFLGRLIQEDDDPLEGGNPVAVLGYGCWQQRFGGVESILNRKVMLNGHPMVVIGVAPPTFRGVLSGRAPQVYVPLAMRRQMKPAMFDRPDVPERDIRYLNVLARLKPGVARKQAEAATQVVFQGIVEELVAQSGMPSGPRVEKYRRESLAKRVQLVPAYQGIHALRESLEQPLTWLAAMVGLVLLVASVNVAGLLMARSMARGREIAIRLALGSGRGALVRQLLTESVLLGLLGGLAGLLVARWTMDLLLGLSSDGVSSLVPDLDGRVLTFNFALAVLTGVLFGLAPVWHALRTSIVHGLKARSGCTGEQLRGAGFRKGAIVAQVALSFLLLVAAGLFTRSLYNLRNLDPGFRIGNILTFALDPGLGGYDRERGDALYEELLERLRRLPGVQAATAAQVPLLANSRRGGSIAVEGFHGEDASSSRNLVGSGYFRALDIPLPLGRAFTGGDRQGSPKVAVVNETFVRRYFGGRSPLGRHLAFAAGTPKLDVEIVGVAKDIRPANLRDEVKPLVYTPFLQDEGLPSLTFYLRTTREEKPLASDVRRTVSALDPELPVYKMLTLSDARDQLFGVERMSAVLSGAFAGLATLLVAIGLYGLLAYTVARRTPEIGLRMALGAGRRDVVGLVMKQALTYVAIGLAIGLPGALGLGRYMGSRLFGLRPNDPLVAVGALLVLALSASAAAFLQARRAAKVEPVQALRSE